MTRKRHPERPPAGEAGSEGSNYKFKTFFKKDSK
jgi:hypothetical protein